jgi:homoserine acetyltransferase
MIGADMALDPNRYFIVTPNMFGNGLSISPSNAPPPHDRGRFPHVTLYDNVMQQTRLLSERFGIDRVKLVTGFSMGAQQTFHWGAMFPEMVERIAPICGAAKTSRHNVVFLESVKAALTVDPAFCDGWFAERPERGLRAVARAFAAWAVSPAVYRKKNRHDARLRDDRGIPGQWLGSQHAQARRQQRDGDVVELAARRHQRQRALWRRSRGGPRRDPGARARDAERHGLLFHCRRQPSRGRSDAKFGVADHSIGLGSPCRQSDAKSG